MEIMDLPRRKQRGIKRIFLMRLKGRGVIPIDIINEFDLFIISVYVKFKYYMHSILMVGFYGRKK